MTGLNHGNILPHHRANFETTEAAMIRFSGLVQALEIVADGITEAEPKSSAGWCAFYALTNELIDKMDALHRLRTIEWVGLGGGGHGLPEAQVAAARGEVPA